MEGNVTYLTGLDKYAGSAYLSPMKFDIEMEIRRETARWKERNMSRCLGDRNEPDYRMQEELEQERRAELESILDKLLLKQPLEIEEYFTVKREFGL